MTSRFESGNDPGSDPASHFPRFTFHFPLARSGQAMVELVAALVCILVVLAGLLQIVLLSTADTDTLVEASARAASRAASPLALAASLPVIENWTPGRDGLEQTRDDVAQRGSLARVQGVVASPTAPGGDWSAVEAARHGRLAELHHGLLPSTTFGLVRGNASRTVEVLPVAHALFGLRSPMEIENEVWMSTLGGLY